MRLASICQPNRLIYYVRVDTSLNRQVNYRSLLHIMSSLDTDALLAIALQWRRMIFHIS